MERSAHKAAKQDDVQFDDGNLRGETWKYHILSVNKISMAENFYSVSYKLNV